jgi:WhiB family transcriptional regulator, redox-sensing transcriptional regulator
MSAAEVLHPTDHEIVVPRGVHWQEYAVCKGHTDLFFARKAERPQARERREAKADRLCATCPVRVPCRTFARENHEYGFWGGENEEDRHLLGYTVSAPIGIRARQAGSRIA